jgi:hypothetical protein
MGRRFGPDNGKQNYDVTSMKYREQALLAVRSLELTMPHRLESILRKILEEQERM